jgi:uncharacterized delta-60 repeat protein
MAQPGTLDLSFDPGVGPNDAVYRVFPQADGKVIIVGAFTEVSGVPRGGVARLLEDGSVDLTYATGAGAVGPIYSGVQQADGKMVLSGNMSSFDAINCSHLIRLNTDGTLDTSYQVDLQTYFASGITLDQQGRILMVGGFTFVNGAPCGRIVRLNPDGSTDQTFDSGVGFNSQANVICVDLQGRIWVTGYFTYYEGATAPGITRLLPNGHIDPAFTPASGPDAVVLAMATKPAGGAVISGVFNYYNNTPRQYICALLDNGLVDPAFIPSGQNITPAYGIALGPVGDVFAGAVFHFQRFMPNGSIDANFSPVTGQLNMTIYDVAFTTNGAIMIGGDFTTYLGVTRNHLARINNCPTWYQDMDGDGLGSLWWESIIDCVQPAGYVANHDDCNDEDPTVGSAPTWFQDADHDLAGNAAVSIVSCSPGYGWVLNTNDCDDADPTAQFVQNWYVDMDGDGFGDPTSGISSCLPIAGRVTDGTDCNDTDPNSHPGTSCNDGIATTYFDSVGPDCVCAGIPCAMGPILEITPDDIGTQTTWEIRDENNVIVTGGGPYTSGGPDLIVEDMCLPEGCYRLVVYDSQGNGMCNGNVEGGYLLRIPNDRGGYPIIDNRHTGCFAATSAIATTAPTYGRFCLPLGDLKTEDRYIEPRQNLHKFSTIACYEDPEVSAQYGVGNQADDGYDFCIFEPNSYPAPGYSRVMRRTHASPGSSGPDGPTKCSYLKLNYSTNALGSNQWNRWMNVRVRSIVNGVIGDFGPAYRIWINTLHNCTQLWDEPGYSQHSCGVSRINNVYNKIWCYPVQSSPAPTNYRFTFTENGSGYNKVITTTGTQCQLGWTPQPLVNGHTYNVSVHAKVGGVWQPACGESCTVTINNPPGQQFRSMEMANEGPDLLLWPNPNHDGHLTISVEDLGQVVDHASISVLDIFGRSVYSSTFSVIGAGLNYTIDLGSAFAKGMYIVQVSAGEHLLVRKLVVD